MPCRQDSASPSFFPSRCPWRLLDPRCVQVSSFHSVPREEQPLLPSAAGRALGRVPLGTPPASRSRAAAGSALPSRRVPLPAGQPHSREPRCPRRPAAAAAIFPGRGAVAGRPAARGHVTARGGRGPAGRRCPFPSRARPRHRALLQRLRPRRPGCSAGCGARGRADPPGRGRQVPLR